MRFMFRGRWHMFQCLNSQYLSQTIRKTKLYTPNPLRPSPGTMRNFNQLKSRSNPIQIQTENLYPCMQFMFWGRWHMFQCLNSQYLSQTIRKTKFHTPNPLRPRPGTTHNFNQLKSVSNPIQIQTENLYPCMQFMFWGRWHMFQCLNSQYLSQTIRKTKFHTPNPLRPRPGTTHNFNQLKSRSNPIQIQTENLYPCMQFVFRPPGQVAHVLVFKQLVPATYPGT